MPTAGKRLRLRELPCACLHPTLLRTPTQSYGQHQTTQSGCYGSVSRVRTSRHTASTVGSRRDAAVRSGVVLNVTSSVFTCSIRRTYIRRVIAGVPSGFGGSTIVCPLVYFEYVARDTSSVPYVKVLMGDRSYLANGVAHSAITMFAEKLLIR